MKKPIRLSRETLRTLTLAGRDLRHPHGAVEITRTSVVDNCPSTPADCTTVATTN